MSRRIDFPVEERCAGMKIYDFLKKHQRLSYRLITSLKHRPEGILRNGEHARTIDRIQAGDVVSVTMPQVEQEQEACDLPVELAYEDEDVLVYNKPAGMNCHQSRRFQNDTLANVFAAYCQKRGMALVFRCINRLDKDTSGLVMVAKNQHAAALLKNAAEKEYLAVVCGVPEPARGVVDAPIRRINDVYTKREVSQEGQPARTHYQVLAAGEDGRCSLVHLSLETGRTHQIRVHMAHLGHPLAGDDMYGGSTELIGRQALHCFRMRFTSPITGEPVEVEAPLPKDIQKIMDSAKIYMK